jgi:hypothetical protein
MCYLLIEIRHSVVGRIVVAYHQSGFRLVLPTPDDELGMVKVNFCFIRSSQFLKADPLIIQSIDMTRILRYDPVEIRDRLEKKPVIAICFAHLFERLSLVVEDFLVIGFDHPVETLECLFIPPEFL